MPDPLQFVDSNLEKLNRQRAKIFAKHIQPVLQEIAAIPDEFARWYWTLVLKTKFSTKRRAWHREFEKPDERYARLTEAIRDLKSLRALLVSPRKEKSREQFQTRITAAKERPITDLYSFKRLRRSGRRWMASCPFHSDTTPSFVIYPDNSFHCFSCREHGDSIAFAKKTQGLSFRDAVKTLAGGEI